MKCLWRYILIRTSCFVLENLLYVKCKKWDLRGFLVLFSHNWTMPFFHWIIGLCHLKIVLQPKFVFIHKKRIFVKESSVYLLILGSWEAVVAIVVTVLKCYEILLTEIWLHFEIYACDAAAEFKYYVKLEISTFVNECDTCKTRTYNYIELLLSPTLFFCVL